MQQSLRALLRSQPYAIETVESPTEDAKYTGVWVTDKDKIASIGVQVRHRVTSHGFALNVDNRALEGFSSIVACGLPDVRMTSVSEQLGKRSASPHTDILSVATMAASQLAQTLQREHAPLADGTIRFHATRDGDVLDSFEVDGVRVTR